MSGVAVADARLHARLAAGVPRGEHQRHRVVVGAAADDHSLGHNRLPRPGRALGALAQPLERRDDRARRRRRRTRRTPPPSAPCCRRRTRRARAGRAAGRPSPPPATPAARCRSRWRRPLRRSRSRGSWRPTVRASSAPVRSLSSTASTPRSAPSSRTIGIPPPPQATTIAPSSISASIVPRSRISSGRGEGTTRRQPREPRSCQVSPAAIRSPRLGRARSARSACVGCCEGRVVDRHEHARDHGAHEPLQPAPARARPRAR